MNDTYPSARITLAQLSNTYAVFVVLIAIALLLPETTQNPDRYRTIFTIWATIVLLIPALCLYLFSSASTTIYQYWRLFWTFSYLAYLFHFYWAVFVIFKGIEGTFAAQGNLIASINFLLTVWWGVDVVLSWFIIAPQGWFRLERAAVHVFVFTIFVATTLLLRPTPITKFLGVSLASLVTLSFVVRFFVSAPTQPPDTRSIR